MKRFAAIYLILSLVVMSCSKEQGISSDVPCEESVPIEFEIPITKGAIYSEEDLINNTSVFGMFAVDTETESLTEDDGLNMRNQLCRYVAATESTKAGLRFGYVSEDKEIYFPFGSKNAYDFYTYHTWTSKFATLEDGTTTIVNADEVQSVSEIISNDRQIHAVLGLGNPYDILWAKSEIPETDKHLGYKGYNASYIRETGNVPTFRFQHPAAGIRFRTVLAEGSTSTILKNDHIRIMAITFTGAESGTVTTSGALCVVDLDNPENEGKFVKSLTTVASKNWMDSNNSTGNLCFDVLADADGDGIVETCLTEPAQISSEHFIMPMDEPLQVTVTMRRQRINAEGTITGNWTPVVKTFTLDPAEFGASESGYKAGMMYNYKIVVDYTNSTPSVPANDVIDFEIVADK